MIKLFNAPLSKVSTIWIDTETTGTRPGSDKAVQIGLVRFENGVPVAQFELVGAHSAGADARAAWLLFYKIVRDVFKADPTLGAVLHWQRLQEAEEWFRFMEYKAKQPPMEGGAA